MTLFKTFNLTDIDAVDKIKEAVKGGFTEFDDKSNMKYIKTNSKDEIKVVFKLDRNIIEEWFRQIFNLLRQLEEKGELEVFEKKSGLFQTCRYACEDAQTAIDSFKDFKVKVFNEHSYLLLYGLLQALIIQQDAVQKFFYLSLGIQLVFSEEFPELKNIREIRNNTIGHPTDRFKGKKYFLISAPTLKKSGYYLVEHNQEDIKLGKQIEVFPKLLHDQEDVLIKVFDVLYKELENRLK